MALLDIKGLEFLKEINWSNLVNSIYGFIIFLIILLIVAGITIFFVYRSKEKKLYNKEILFFKEVHGEPIPYETCACAEITIPHSNIRVFYIKIKDMYLPVGMYEMGKGKFWYFIKQNREIVNFTIKNMNKDMKEAGLEYDHTDMRYASANLHDIIQKNYRDKALKWWKEYKDVIAIVIFVFVFTLSFWFLLGKIGNLLDKIVPLIDKVNQILEVAIKLEESRQGSGIITV